MLWLSRDPDKKRDTLRIEYIESTLGSATGFATVKTKMGAAVSTLEVNGASTDLEFAVDSIGESTTFDIVFATSDSKSSTFTGYPTL